MSLIKTRNMFRMTRMAFEAKPFNITINTQKLLDSTKRFTLERISAYTTASNQTSKAPDAEDTSAPDCEILKTQINELNGNVEKLAELNKTLDDKYKRSLADAENLRMRMNKQVQDAKLFGIQSFCKDLLDVADILNRATESVPKEEVNEKNPHLKSLYEGLKMTEQQLLSVFKRNSLEQVNPIGEKFDPNYHEALFQQEAAGKEPGTVIVVSKIGYKLHDRCIRPALVGVAKS